MYLGDERRFEVDRHLERDDRTDENGDDRRQADRVQSQRLHFIDDATTVDRPLLRPGEDLAHQDKVTADQFEDFQHNVFYCLSGSFLSVSVAGTSSNSM